MSRENCIAIRPFISSEEECQSLCQKSKTCGYYKYIQGATLQEMVISKTLIFVQTRSPRRRRGERTCLLGDRSRSPDCQVGAGTLSCRPGRSLVASRQSSQSNTYSPLDPLDADTPEFCYLLSSCSKRIIDNHLCTVGQNNLLDVKLFTPSLAACRDHCERTTECRYYYWYPISYSSAPLYCYLFRQCAIKDDEPTVALVMGGRHPGHYFMDSDDFNDIVTRNQVGVILRY